MTKIAQAIQTLFDLVPDTHKNEDIFFALDSIRSRFAPELDLNPLTDEDTAARLRSYLVRENRGTGFDRGTW